MTTWAAQLAEEGLARASCTLPIRISRCSEPGGRSETRKAKPTSCSHHLRLHGSSASSAKMAAAGMPSGKRPQTFCKKEEHHEAFDNDLGNEGVAPAGALTLAGPGPSRCHLWYHGPTRAPDMLGRHCSPRESPGYRANRAGLSKPVHARVSFPGSLLRRPGVAYGGASCWALCDACPYCRRAACTGKDRALETTGTSRAQKP